MKLSITVNLKDGKEINDIPAVLEKASNIHTKIEQALVLNNVGPDDWSSMVVVIVAD